MPRFLGSIRDANRSPIQVARPIAADTRIAASSHPHLQPQLRLALVGRSTGSGLTCGCGFLAALADGDVRCERDDENNPIVRGSIRTRPRKLEDLLLSRVEISECGLRAGLPFPDSSAATTASATPPSTSTCSQSYDRPVLLAFQGTDREYRHALLESSFTHLSLPPPLKDWSYTTTMSSKEPTMAAIAKQILEDALQQIVHDIVVQRHREHKMLLASLDAKTRLPHCDTCNLPHQLDPPLAPAVRGATSDPPSNTNYCDRKPWTRKAGHDIYGNPFLKSDVTGRPLTKKEREAQAAEKKKDKNGGGGTPASQDPDADGTGPPSPNENDEAGGRKLEKGEKKASKIDEKLRKGEYVPWHTCPSCKRSLLITRFAKHLEQCMGLSGRAASRNAMAKMNGTPSGSRGGTPNPTGSQDGVGASNGKDSGNGNGEDDEDDISVKGPGLKKKLLKKGLKEKAKKDKNGGGGANGKLPKSLTTAGRASNNGGTQRSSPAPSSVGGGEKRDRDELGEDDEDEVHVKKRQKLQRVGSTASMVSQSTAAPEMERTDSLDGSFVDGSVADE